jgi:hypothetical protein
MEITFKGIPLTLTIYETDTEFEVEDVLHMGVSCLPIIGVNEMTKIESFAMRERKHQIALAKAEQIADSKVYYPLDRIIK